MKIQFEVYNPEWNQWFEHIKNDLIEAIGFVNPRIEHIGSTSIVGLSAKPIIDILVGLAHEEDLETIITPLVEQGYVYFEIYNELMPYRRFFVKHKSSIHPLTVSSLIREERDIPKNTLEHSQRLAHIHILSHGSEHWTRHIAFRDYLRSHPSVKKAYQQLKEQLSKQEWADGNEYNKAKDQFIKTEEQHAIEWFNRNKDSWDGENPSMEVS